MVKHHLIALKKIGKHSVGSPFKANSVEAKALVALKRAKYSTPDQALPIYTGDSDLFAVQPSHDLRVIQKSDDEESAPRSDDGLLISQPVREFALENGIDLSAVVGTGKDGRINRKDIEFAISAKSEANDQTNNS